MIERYRNYTTNYIIILNYNYTPILNTLFGFSKTQMVNVQFKSNIILQPLLTQIMTTMPRSLLSAERGREGAGLGSIILNPLLTQIIFLVFSNISWNIIVHYDL